MNIILASQSPRRKELLNQIGIEFTTISSDKEEIANLNNGVDEYSKELAYIKAKDVFNKTNGERIVIGADTVVCINEKILGKPHSINEAYNMLEELQGNVCNVITGLCVISYENEKIHIWKETGKASVKICQMTEKEIKEYISTGEPMDKAGAFAIQGIGGKYIETIEGDYYSIVGLPINKLYEILKAINKGSDDIE